MVRISSEGRNVKFAAAPDAAERTDRNVHPLQGWVRWVWQADFDSNSRTYSVLAWRSQVSGQMWGCTRLGAHIGCHLGGPAVNGVGRRAVQ